MDALAGQQFDGSYEVIVVDNGSNDDTAAIAERSPARPVVLRRARGEGPAAARNAGVERAAGKVLAFTDADCEPEPEWLAAGMAALGEADLAQGKVVPAGAVGEFDRTVRVLAESGLYETANLFLRRGLFEDLGGFENLVAGGDVAFGEDVLFGWKAKRAGARTTFAPDAVVRHAVFPRSPAGYVEERVRLRFFPLLARRVPELRRRGFFARIFLSRRTAAFDLALAGAVGAVLATPFALLGAAPYAWMLGRSALRGGPARAPVVAPCDLAADAVGLASLIAGSARYRAPLF
jgi:glycosyltransferase involved in cell wall biosynthesis